MVQPVPLKVWNSYSIFIASCSIVAYLFTPIPIEIETVDFDGTGCMIFADVGWWRFFRVSSLTIAFPHRLAVSFWGSVCVWCSYIHIDIMILWSTVARMLSKASTKGCRHERRRRKKRSFQKSNCESGHKRASQSWMVLLSLELPLNHFQSGNLLNSSDDESSFLPSSFLYTAPVDSTKMQKAHFLFAIWWYTHYSTLFMATQKILLSLRKCAEQ